MEIVPEPMDKILVKVCLKCNYIFSMNRENSGAGPGCNPMPRRPTAQFYASVIRFSMFRIKIILY